MKIARGLVLHQKGDEPEYARQARIASHSAYFF